MDLQLPLTVEFQHLILLQYLAREAMLASTGTAQSLKASNHLVAPMLTTLFILSMKHRVRNTFNLTESLKSTFPRMEAITPHFSSHRRTRQLTLGRTKSKKKKRRKSIPQAGIAPPSSILLPRFLSNRLLLSQFSPPATLLDLETLELVASNLPNLPRSLPSTWPILQLRNPPRLRPRP